MRGTGMALIAIIFTLSSFDKPAIDEKLQSIDKYVSEIDSNLSRYALNHTKCSDCFGTDKYSQPNGDVVKIHNYQSCFNIDFYYRKKRLVLVAIDGSFKRDCGYTEAPYCWDSTIVRDYKAKIYYEGKKILQQKEEGSNPCCAIKPCGEYEDAVDFNNKASVFLKLYGQAESVR